MINNLFRKFPVIVIFLALSVSFLNNFIEIPSLFSSNIIGYSILFNLVIIYFLIKLKYCIYTILAMINLTFLNLFNVLQSFDLIDYHNYSFYYDSSTTFIMFLTMIIYSVKK